MKKTILAMIMAGSSCAAFAQVDSMNRTNGNWNNAGMADTSLMGMNNGTLSSNNSYNAYGTFNATAPDYVSSYVIRDYPTASDIHWQQSADWWHGYYLSNGLPTHIYYNTSGQSFTTALPVKQNLIPDDVISKATTMWGPSIYDITTIRGGNGQDIYLVRTIDNGQLNAQWIGQDGSKVIDIYRVDNIDPMTSTNAATSSDVNTTSTDAQSSSSSTPAKRNTINDADGVMSNTSTTGGTSNDKAQADDSVTGSNASATTTDANSSDMGNGTKAGSDKMKIKTRTPDGKKKVTKIVNGKVSTKGQE